MPMEHPEKFRVHSLVAENSDVTKKLDALNLDSTNEYFVLFSPFFILLNDSSYTNQSG
jgi:hypothetical protein